MTWLERLIESENVEPTTEKNLEYDGTTDDGKTILDYQTMSNNQLLEELETIRSSANVIKELQEIGENVDNALKLLNERYGKIKTIIYERGIFDEATRNLMQELENYLGINEAENILNM